MENRRSFIKKSGLFLAASSLSLAAFPSPFGRRKSLVENKVVTLYVDTVQIQGQDISEYCNFGQPEDVSNEDFTVACNVGDTVTWQGVSTSAPSTDIVHIHSIRHHHGRKVFDLDEVGGDGRSPQRVSRRVLYSTAGDQNFKYILRFTVSRNGAKPTQVFQIDPVLQVH